MLLISLCLSLLPALPATPAPQAPAQGVDLKSACDLTLHWLREAQAADGRYGQGVEDTAWVLHAFAISPRRYKVEHGPFVSRAVAWLGQHQGQDGSIADAQATGDARVLQTRLAARAIEEAGGAPEPVARAEAFVRGELGEPFALELPADEAALRALLATRSEDGAWHDAPDAVRATARNAAVLGTLYARRPAGHGEGGGQAAVKSLPPLSAADLSRLDDALRGGGRFLASRADAGRFGPPGDPNAGVTAMAIGGLLAVPEPRPEEIQKAIDQGLAWLRTLQREDGAFTQGGLANYVTSATVLALARAGDPQDAERIAKARDWLVALQADEGEHYSPDDPYYGGIGYGNDERPDLSNLQFALEAMSAGGLPKEHEAYQRALRFLERCQNRSESNTVVVRDGDELVKSGDDGGGIYAPGDSEVGFVDLGDGVKVAISYGSMTYALLKGYVLAGLERDDPRVQAAWRWIQQHWTLDVNPGFESTTDPRAAYSGLFYYLLAMARALDVYGEERVTDAAGDEHLWRAEIAARLLAMQSRKDGSWVNENSGRWWEGDPTLATAYALLTLDVARPSRASEAGAGR